MRLTRVRFEVEPEPDSVPTGFGLHVLDAGGYEIAEDDVQGKQRLSFELPTQVGRARTFRLTVGKSSGSVGRDSHVQKLRVFRMTAETSTRYFMDE
jgi:hypothetical protein